jgi:hypothetical protein
MSSSANKHPTDDTLELHALKQLPESEREPLEEHLLVCEECRQRLDKTEDYVAAMQQALTEIQQESTQPSGFWAWVPRVPKPVWAGVLAVVAAVLIIVPMQLRTGGTPYDLNLTAYRGDQAVASPAAPAGSKLTLHIDITGLPEVYGYGVQVANADGAVVFDKGIYREGDVMTIPLERTLPAGQYWVRVYEPRTRSLPLREYGFRLE